VVGSQLAVAVGLSVGWVVPDEGVAEDVAEGLVRPGIGIQVREEK